MIQYSSANIRAWSRMGPSGAFGAAAMELGRTRDDMVVVSADMSFASGIERFKAKYPERHFEVGIAEQNLVGVAAGMASEGLLPYAATYATFFSARALDQIKANLGYMRQNVKLVGVLAGFAAGILGPTHMAIEDIAIMRSIPNMTVISPADAVETIKALLAAAYIDGPVYVRLTGGMSLPPVYREDFDFRVGKAVRLREGTDAAIIAAGTMVNNAMLAAERLMAAEISCTVLNMHTIKPLDTDALDELRSVRLVVSIEEHSVIGGLGGAVAEYLSGLTGAPPLLRLGVGDAYPRAGSLESLILECGLTAEQIADSILERLKDERIP